MAQVTVRDLVAYGLEHQPLQVTVRDLVAYGIEPVTPGYYYREAAGFLLRDDPRGNGYREAAGFFLRSARNPDFTKDGKTALLAAVNKEWSLGLTAAKVDWVNPRIAPSTDGFSSLVTIVAKPGSKLLGQYDIRYNRYELIDAFVGKDVGSFIVSQNTTVYALLPVINSQFNLALTTNDVQDGSVIANHSVTLRAGTGSFWFNPGGQVILGTAGSPSLDAAIVIADLSGFAAA